MVRSLIFIAGIGGALLGCGVLRAESASTADDRQTRCIVVELYVSGSEATPPEALIREELQSRAGIQLRRFDISGDAPAADRWRQIRERFQISVAALPAVYSGGEVVTNDGDEQAFRRKLESLLQLTVFVRSGCPHCADAKGYLQTIKRQYPGLAIVFRNLATDKTAGADLQVLVQRYRKSAVSVPVFHVFNQIVVGFDNTGSAARRLDKVLSQWSVSCDTVHRDSAAKRQEPSSVMPDRSPLDSNRPGESDVLAETPEPSPLRSSHPLFESQQCGVFFAATSAALGFVSTTAIEDSLAEAGSNEEPDLLPLPDSSAETIGSDSNHPGQAEGAAAADSPEEVDVPILGTLSVRSLGLPLFTVAVGLVDGFNPCAMWVLLFLLSILVNLHSRTRILAVAGTFVLISGLAYFAFMAAWLTIFQFIGFLRPAQVVLGLVAMLIGAIHIKDFFAFKRGISLSIPESAKPGIYARVRRIVTAENLTGAVIGAITLAVLVNVIELLCTAGLPALYTEILSLQKLPAWKEYSYLALYNLAYMADDALMVTLVVITLGRRKLQEREGRWLKLLSGAVIFALGLVMVVNPELLI